MTVLEDVYRQIDDAERKLRDSTHNLDNLRDVQAKLAEAVGRGEAADGHVLVEYTAAGLRELTIDPRAMRMTSEELAEAVKEALGAAVQDFRAQSAQALRDAGLAGADGETDKPDLAAIQERLGQARDRYSSVMRTAAQQLDEASRLRRQGRPPA